MDKQDPEGDKIEPDGALVSTSLDITFDQHQCID